MNSLGEFQIQEEQIFNCHVSTVSIKTEKAARKLNRQIGKYITIYCPTPFDQYIEIAEVGECLAIVLNRILHPYHDGTLCICGLGNQKVTADSLGPEVLYNLPLKVLETKQTPGTFQKVFSIAPGTEFSNGINTETLIKGIVQETHTTCLLLIDSSITEDPTQLAQTIQLSTAGGTNPFMAKRKGNWTNLNIPVISLCVPTTFPLYNPNDKNQKTMLTDIHIQDAIFAASITISYALLRVFWPSLSKQECFILAKQNHDPLPFSTIWFEETEDNTPIP